MKITPIDTKQFQPYNITIESQEDHSLILDILMEAEESGTFPKIELEKIQDLIEVIRLK